MPKGWFAIDGIQEGDRSISVQMLGLHPALKEAKGRSVLDLGCAEGCISFAFVEAGAARVFACDNSAPLLKTAVTMRRRLSKPKRMAVEFAMRDVRAMKPDEQFDIVLALAIVHKLDDPCQGVRLVADSCRNLAVFRLPRNQVGTIKSKHTQVACGLDQIMSSRGFRLERTEQGPPNELVQYWRRWE